MCETFKENNFFAQSFFDHAASNSLYRFRNTDYDSHATLLQQSNNYFQIV